MAWRLDYSTTFRPTPITRWVHKAKGRKVGESQRAYKTETRKMVVDFEPPVPLIIGKGYVQVIVNLETNEEMRFSSLHEMNAVLAAIESGNLKDQPWLEDMPSKAFAPGALAATRQSIARVYDDLRASGELG